MRDGRNDGGPTCIDRQVCLCIRGPWPSGAPGQAPGTPVPAIVATATPPEKGRGTELRCEKQSPGVGWAGWRRFLSLLQLWDSLQIGCALVKFVAAGGARASNRFGVVPSAGIGSTPGGASPHLTHFKFNWSRVLQCSR